MLKLIKGGAGTGKSYRLAELIKESAAEGRETLVIVPEQFDFEYNRALYNFMGMRDYNRITVCGFSRLARQILIKYGGLRGKYADDTVKRAVMFRALSNLNTQKSLQYFDRQAKNPRFINDALEYVKTMSSNGISAEYLAERTQFMNDHIRGKALDISLIYSEYSRLLREYGYKDGSCDMTEAAKRAAENGYFRGQNVYIDEFKSFTADEYPMLSAMIAQADTMSVCLTTEDESPREYSLFETVNRTAARLEKCACECNTEIQTEFLTENHRYKHDELTFLSSNILRTSKAKYDGECNAIKVYESAEPYEEADFVCAEIRALMEQGFRCSDIMVLARQKEIYSSILDSAFERNGIPYYSDEKEGAAHKALFIFLRTALKLAAAKKPFTEDILRYIKTGFAGLDTAKCDILEEYCYKWGVEGKMWNEPFRISPDEPADKIAEGARSRIMEPIDKLRSKCENTTADGICRAILEFLDDTHASSAVMAYIQEAMSGSADILYAAREAKQLWELLCGLLQTLYTSLGGVPMTLTEFCGLFEVTVAGLSLSSPPQTLDAVSFSASHTARLANPKVIFVIGANEGALPFSAKPSALLSDRDIEALRSGGVDIAGSSGEKLADERYVAYASLSGASERLYISYPIADIGGKALYPSSCVKQICAMFDGIKHSVSELDELYFCTTEQNGYYRYVQEYKRQSIDTASLRRALEEYSPENKKRFEFFDDPTAVSGHKNGITSDTAHKLYGKLELSASRMEDYRLCPFMYFCKKGLKIYPRSKVDLSAPSYGTVVHYCLSSILNDYPKASFVKLERPEVKAVVEKLMKQYFDSRDVGGSYGKIARYLHAYNSLSDTLTDILMRLKNEFLQSDFTPDSFEYKIGSDGMQPAAEITLPNSEKVYFTGAVDRVDIYKDSEGQQYIRVVDYKTGAKDLSYADLYYGINMQMILYLFALTDPNCGGKYAGSEPAGVLYMPAKDAPLAPSRDASDKAQRESADTDTYRMKGLVLEDVDIVKAMEKEGRYKYIPVKLKDGSAFEYYSKVITSKELANLRKYSADIIAATAADIINGKIEADPLVNKNHSPCSYCDYRSVCGNYPNIRSRSYDPDAKNKMKDILSK